MAHASKSALQLTALALALSSIGAQADTITWANDASGNWTIPLNWTPLGLPTNNSDVVISVTGVKTITHDLGLDTIRTLSFQAGTPNPNATLVVTNTAAGSSSLTVTSGGTNGGVIRADNGTVNFTGGTFVNTAGTLSAINGGVVSFQNTTLQGGTLSTDASTAVQFANGSTLDGSTHGAITNNGAVQIAQSASVFGNGTITNNGSIVVGANAYLRMLGTNSLTLNGSGSLTLATDPNIGARSQLFTDNGTITNGASHTINGVGDFGNNSTTIVNQGTVTANVSGRTLAIDPTGGTRDTVGLTNSGMLRAENGGQLYLQSGTYNNAAGTIQARTGSQVYLNGADIQGGTLATVGTGSIIAQAGAVLDGVTAGTLNNAGALTLANSTTVYALGTINNTGSIKVGPNTDFRAIGSDAITFTGNGTVTLASDANIGAPSQLYTDNNTLITNGAGHTIQGYGNLGRGSSIVLNNGSVLANDTTGPLNVNVGGNTFTNNGVLRADGSTLNLQQGTFVNNTTIGAANGGTVNITGGATVIQGGTLSTDSGSHTYIGGSARLDGSTNGMITNVGTLTENQSTTVFVNGAIRNTGAIVVGANSDLRATGTDAITFTGNGAVTLASITNFGAAAQLYTDNNTLITNGTGHTIQGYGNLGRGSSAILNNGSVLANDATGPLNVNVGGNTFTNNGVFRADGSTLNLQQGTFVNNTTIGSINSGTVNISGGATVIQGGILSTASGGSMIISGSARLDGTTHGAITNAGNLTEAQSTTVFVNGTINNTGVITIGANSDFRATGTDAINLTGTGTVTLASITNFGAAAQLYTDNGTITNGAGHTIQGYGNLGRGSSTIVNNGSVLANDATGPLNVSVGSNTFTNNGVFRADGSTLNLQQGTFVNNTTIGAINNGTVNISGGATVIQGGILSTANGGSMTITGGARLDGATNGTLTNAGNLTEAQSTTVYANGTINNTGSITIGANSDFRATGTDSIAFTGNGTVTLASVTGFGAPAQLYTDNGTITNGAGHTIQGYGNVGRGSSILSNSGVIDANASGQVLSLSTVGAVSNLSTGVLQATNGGTLNIGQAVTGTGTIRSDTGGTVVLNQSAQVGKLINNAHIDVGDYSVTVSSDYNNANFGTGNNFDKHAGVLSYGQPIPATNQQAYILASGNVAQAVTGAKVTNGSDGSPTLTIGNVRVGATTLNYQVANTGTDGPSIRGALQTSVNGGNITDSRLSGSGVTAGNYGPIGTGANSGNLGVTFTATTAGALAPLAGQAVHIANNFDNVAEQTLGIALGSGAAAYNVAQASVPTTVNLGNVHVGTSASQGVTIGNTNISPAGYQEGLDVSVGTRSAGATGSGSITNLAAGNTSNSVVVGLSNIGAGNRSGTVALNLASNGSTTSGLDTLALAPATVTVNATGYNLASASVAPSPIVFTNAHVGDTRTQALTVTNTGPGGAYTEGLTASIGSVSGNVSTTGSNTGLIAAQANSTALGVKLDTGSAGAKTGSVSVALTSDGSGTSGLGTTALASQSVAVSGNVYNLAASSTIGAVNFGLHHVGDGTVTQNVSVTNTAAGGNFSEGLDTSFGAVTGTGAGMIHTSGVVTNLAAQSTSASTLKVSLDTSQVGTVNGNVRVIQASNGTISGLGNTALPDQNPAVTADVQANGTTVRYAVGQINNAPVAFGAVRINTAQNQALSITNAVPNDGYSESLVAGIAGSSGKATGSGGFGTPTTVPALAPSATDNTHVIVGLDTSAAGHQAGSVSVNFKSDGTAFAGGTITDRGNTAVAVSGDVYRLASPTVAATPITVAARVNGTGPTTSIGVTNTSADIYTEALSVSRGATSAGFTSSGSITNLAAGGSSGLIGVTLNTAVAGTFNGTQTLNYVSTGAGTDGAADLSIGSGSVTLNGKVYTTAIAQSNAPSPINFGIVHVGDTVTAQGVSVTNAAATTALNDVLTGSAIGASGPFTASGNLGAGLAAGTTSTNGLKVGLNTTAAGNYSGSATFSAASHDSDLTDAALANLAVSLVGTVNNYATDSFSKTSGAGTLTRNGSTFILDYGTVTQNSGTLTSSLVANNSATGPADALSGTFEFLDPADFGESGFAAFLNLAAGMSDGPLTFSFNTASAGSFVDSIILHGIGSNASGYAAGIGDIELIVRGIVNAAGTPPSTNVPEPDSLLLLGLGLPLLFLRRRRKDLH